MKATEETEVIAHFIHTSSEDNVTCRGDLKLYLPKSLIFKLKQLVFLKSSCCSFVQQCV